MYTSLSQFCQLCTDKVEKKKNNYHTIFQSDFSIIHSNQQCIKEHKNLYICISIVSKFILFWFLIKILQSNYLLKFPQALTNETYPLLDCSGKMLKCRITWSIDIFYVIFCSLGPGYMKGSLVRHKTLHYYFLCFLKMHSYYPDLLLLKCILLAWFFYCKLFSLFNSSTMDYSL